MNRKAISTVVAFLSILGAIASSAALLATLGKILAPSELTVSLIVTAAGVLAGISSMYLARAGRKLRRAPRIFLSYSHNDADTASKVAEALRKRGARVWLDVERLRPGDAIRPVIEKAIHDCDRFVVLLSRHPSENLSLEVGLARGKGVPVIPVLLRDAQVPSDLEGIRYVDLRQDESRGLDELVRATT